MKHRPIGFGIFLLCIGIIWVLVNLGVITWSIFDSLLVLWPLILVVIGVVVVFRENAIVRIVAWLLFLAVIVSYSYYTKSDTGNGNTSARSDKVAVEKLDQTRFGNLKLSLGGIRLNVDSDTANLLDAEVEDPYVQNTIDYKNDKETAVLDFSRNRRGFFAGIKHLGKEYDGEFHLNRDVVWDMDVKVGAAGGTIDLSEIKVRNMDVDAGACNLEMIFGSSYDTTNVKIDAGASKLKLVFPGTAGVRIKVDGLLSKEDLDRLGWERREGFYESPNYSEAESKIDLDIDMGAGKLLVDVE